MNEEPTAITERICDFAVGVTRVDIPDAAMAEARIFTLEAVGHMVSGTRQPVGKIVAEHVREMGAVEQAGVVGCGFRTTLAEAAYVNGTLAHTDELEAYGPLPGTGLVPPIAAGLAVGEGTDGTRVEDYLVAMITGVEVQGRLGSSALGAPDRGFMGISLVGPAGAGVTAGKLLGLDRLQMQNCLGIALPLSGGSLRGCGYMTHVHEAGVPARTGVSAALLAARGFTGCPDILDGQFSWGEQFATGGRGYHPEKITENLGDPFFLLEPGSAPKSYGACGLTHQSTEGLLDIMAEHGISHHGIDHVEIVVPPFALRVAAFDEPTTGEQAKFSLRQGVAGILVNGIPTLPYVFAFGDEASRDPAFAAARNRVKITVDESTPNVRGFASQTVHAVLTDGRTLTVVKELASVTGTRTTPLTPGERIEMFRNTVDGLMAPAVAEQVIDLVMDGDRQPLARLGAAITGA